MRRGAVVEMDDAVGEGFGGEEVEADGAMARLDEGDALADEDGKRRREQQRFCAAPTMLPIVASIFTQPLRAGLTYGAPTALFRTGKFKCGRTSSRAGLKCPYNRQNNRQRRKRDLYRITEASSKFRRGLRGKSLLGSP